MLEKLIFLRICGPLLFSHFVRDLVRRKVLFLTRNFKLNLAEVYCYYLIFFNEYVSHLTNLVSSTFFPDVVSGLLASFSQRTTFADKKKTNMGLPPSAVKTRLKKIRFCFSFVTWPRFILSALRVDIPSLAIFFQSSSLFSL